MKKILLIFGTRPEAIKMAPVYQALKQYPEAFVVRVLVTAQHREMLDQVLELFQITPDDDLDIMAQGQTLTELASRILPGVEKVIKRFSPDLVLVHGDTSTTFLASLAAYYQQIPVGHVEAGLRTFDKYSPFPEEMNRRLTGAMADWHFAPTEASRQNLLRENIAPERIFVTGNTVIDALKQTVDHTRDQLPREIASIPQERRLILVTTHRRENWGEPLRQVYLSLKKIVEEHPEVEIVFPIHKNPKVRDMVHDILGGMGRVHLLEPLDYAPFVQVMDRSFMVLTDSGGIQEEAPALGKPVLVLRNTTERPEAVAAGTVALVGTDGERVYQEARRLLRDKAAYEAMARAVNPYGDGEASRRIVDFLRYTYRFCLEVPDEFKGS